MRDDPAVIALVNGANSGDYTAWDQLVERYAPLVWSICRRYRLSRPDTDDAAQGVWLRLVEHLPTLRDPAALPGWLATTTSRECLRVVREGQRCDARERPLPAGPQAGPGGPAEAAADLPEDELLAAELQAALRDGLSSLPERCRRLLSLLIAEPPLPYAQIGARLNMPVGSIGPNRARCLATLRRYPALAALISSNPAGGKTPGGVPGHGEGTQHGERAQHREGAQHGGEAQHVAR